MSEDHQHHTGRMIFTLCLLVGASAMVWSVWLALTNTGDLVTVMLYLWSGIGIAVSGAIISGLQAGGSVA